MQSDLNIKSYSEPAKSYYKKKSGCSRLVSVWIRYLYPGGIKNFRLSRLLKKIIKKLFLKITEQNFNVMLYNNLSYLTYTFNSYPQAIPTNFFCYFITIFVTPKSWSISSSQTWSVEIDWDRNSSRLKVSMYPFLSCCKHFKAFKSQTLPAGRMLPNLNI